MNIAQEPAPDPERFRYASAPRRREQMLRLLSAQGFLSSSALARVLGVSEVTVRRDIRQLSQEGVARSVHGGVSLVSPEGTPRLGGGFTVRARRESAAKRSIAVAASTLIRPGSLLALDAGTTTYELARVFPTDPGVHVATHNLAALPVLLALRSVSVTVLGGEAHEETLSCSGPATIAAVRRLRIDQLFLATSAVLPDGFYCGKDYDAVTKRALLEVSDQVVLLADSSKWQATDAEMQRFAALTAPDVLVADAGLPARQRERLISLGVEVLVAEDARPAVTDRSGP